MTVRTDAQDILYGDFDPGARKRDLFLGGPDWWPQKVTPLEVIYDSYFTGLSVHGCEHVGAPGSWTAAAEAIPEKWTAGAVRLNWNTRILLDERTELNDLCQMAPLDECSRTTRIDKVDEEDHLLTIIYRNTVRKLDLDRTALVRMAAVMEIVDRADGEWRHFSRYRPDLDSLQEMLLYLDAHGQLLGRVMLGDHVDEMRHG